MPFLQRVFADLFGLLTFQHSEVGLGSSRHRAGADLNTAITKQSSRGVPFV
jgi:hypothetical protein